MSKIFDDLNTVMQNRQRQSSKSDLPSVKVSVIQSAPVRGKRTQGWPLRYAITGTLLIVAVTGSVMVNFKTMAELENAKALALVLSRHMDEQKQELAAIRRHWESKESVLRDQDGRISGLQKDLKSLKSNLEETKAVMARIDEMKVNSKLMLEKFIALNDRVRKIEEAKVNKAVGE